MSNHDKIKIQTYLSTMIVIAAMIHVVVGVYFAIISIYFLVWLSVFDIGVHAVTFLMNRAGKTRAASLLFAIKVMSYAVFITFLVGVTVNTQWIILLAILPAALYLDLSKIQRICIIASIPIIVNLTLFLPMVYEPPFNMYGDVVLSFIFANVLVLGLITIIVINIIISNRVASLHAQEIDDITHISNIDPLTKLNNRRYADKFFEKLTMPQMPFLFCLIDIDDFKKINDTHGHDVGDVVLQSLAKLLIQSTRQTDLVCRWGGEEFLIGVPNCNATVGYNILEKIRKSVEDLQVNTATGKLNMTITMGASVMERVDVNAVKIAIAESDRKLYEGKRSGKNKVVI